MAKLINGKTIKVMTILDQSILPSAPISSPNSSSYKEAIENYEHYHQLAAQPNFILTIEKRCV